MKKEIINKKDKVNPHLLIEGENLNILKELNKTFLKKVDVIYIDPPYNGNNRDVRYSDRIDDWDDYIKERIQLSKPLLNDSGIIIVSINDKKLEELLNILNSVFGKKNQIGIIIWKKKNSKNNSNIFSIVHEYLVIYSVNINEVKKKKYFRVKKKGVDDLLKIKNDFEKEIENYENPHLELEKRIREFFKKNPKHSLKSYRNVEPNSFKIFSLADMSKPSGKGYFYKIFLDEFNKDSKIPQRGFSMKEDSFLKLKKNNLVFFGKTGDNVPMKKIYLEDNQTNVLSSVLEINEEGIKTLQSILGKKDSQNNSDSIEFLHPKPVSLIKTIIGSLNDSNLVVLDYFGGSGTTGQAVLELNREDNGNRRFIVCTSNENNIFQDITKKRIKNVLKSEYLEIYNN